MPLQTIVSFLEVNFDSHSARHPFLFTHSMDKLLNHNDVITTTAVRDETSLKRANEISQEWARLVYQNLGNDLIGRVT